MGPWRLQASAMVVVLVSHQGSLYSLGDAEGEHDHYWYIYHQSPCLACAPPSNVPSQSHEDYWSDQIRTYPRWVYYNISHQWLDIRNFYVSPCRQAQSSSWKGQSCWVPHSEVLGQTCLLSHRSFLSHSSAHFDLGLASAFPYPCIDWVSFFFWFHHFITEKWDNFI